MASKLALLVQRAATLPKAYNCQDAVLVIKALSALRLRRPDIRPICEKACFSLASAPEQVAAPVLVDVVNRLCTLQSAQLPVVQMILVKRFCELPLAASDEPAYSNRNTTSLSSSTSSSSRCSVDPRTAQKAAVALIKLSKRDGSLDTVVEHVLRLLHVLLQDHPNDAGMHVAYVALYTHSSRFAPSASREGSCASRCWWQPAHQKALKPSVKTLLASLRFILQQPNLYRRATGNVAWQLLHVLLVLPPSPYTEVEAYGISPRHAGDFEAAVMSETLSRSFSVGAAVSFLQLFSLDLCHVRVTRLCDVLRALVTVKREERLPETSGSASRSLRRMNVYDATKLSNTVSEVLKALPSRSGTVAEQTIRENIVEDVEGDDDDALLREQSTEDRAGEDTEDSEDGDALVCDEASGASASQVEATDSAKEWRKARQLCFRLLECLAEQETTRVHPLPSAMEKTENATASSSKWTCASSPDAFLVAALLHGYAAALRGPQRPRSSLSLSALNKLLSLVPRLDGNEVAASPSMLSWMLVSLASLARSASSGELQHTAAFGDAVTYLFQRYTRCSARQRSLRSDVEVLYAHVRFAAAFLLTTDGMGGIEDKRITSDPSAWPTRSSRENAVGDKGGTASIVSPSLPYSRQHKVGNMKDVVCTPDHHNGLKTSSPATEDPMTSFHGITALMTDVAVRLRPGSKVSHAAAVQREDLDMLLTTLVELYHFVRVVRAGTVSKEQPLAQSSLMDALSDVQESWLACVQNRDATTEDVLSKDLGEVLLRAVRLQVLSGLIEGFPNANNGFVKQVWQLQQRYVSELHTFADLLPSSLMLRALTELERRGHGATPPTLTTATSPNAAEGNMLLLSLCSKYQLFMDKEGALSHPSPEAVSQMVHVLWRSRRAGVQLAFGNDKNHRSHGDKRPLFHRLRSLSLCFPSALCQPKLLTTSTAIDVLQLMAEAHGSDPASIQLSLDAVGELRAALLRHLAQSPSVGSLVRMWRANASLKVSRWLLPTRHDVASFVQATEQCISMLLLPSSASPSLHSDEESSEMLWSGARRRRVSQLLTVVADSELFPRLLYSILNEYDDFRRCILRLAECVERHRARRSDDAAVLKVKLLCGGVA